MSFEETGLSSVLIDSIKKINFRVPTLVQKVVIPEILGDKDLIVCAKTGSGKTAAFSLPILHKILQNSDNVHRNLILVPTRELAFQVSDAIKMYGSAIKTLNCSTIVGGVPYKNQLKSLSSKANFIIATPGRLIDYLTSKKIFLTDLNTLIIDEADRMLDMGFIDDIKMILSFNIKRHQTLLFSATLDSLKDHFSFLNMCSPKRIDLSSTDFNDIKQYMVFVKDLSNKIQLLLHILNDNQVEQAIVFCATKRSADALADELSEQGFSASSLHSDMSQAQRTRTIMKLKRGDTRILVATDIAARGIDIKSITHAINFDFPMNSDDYIHRIGRTGRAGNTGLALTFFKKNEIYKIRQIEKRISNFIYKLVGLPN